MRDRVSKFHPGKPFQRGEPRCIDHLYARGGERRGSGIEHPSPAVDIAGGRIVEPARMNAVPMDAVLHLHVEPGQDQSTGTELDGQIDRLETRITAIAQNAESAGEYPVVPRVDLDNSKLGHLAAANALFATFVIDGPHLEPGEIPVGAAAFRAAPPLRIAGVEDVGRGH